MLPKNVVEILEKQHYGIANHSAVQICRWTKKSLLDEGYCYKQKFYGINSHQCCQMSPCVMWCHNRCLHCWRAIELNLGTEMNGDIDKPEEIIKKCIEARKKLLSGFKGNPSVNKKKFSEALEPKHFAISLSGEPTIYPYIGELIKELRKQKKTSFIVSNGLLPEKITELQREDALPTQFYISLNAPNKEIYKKMCNSSLKDAWERFNKTLTILNKITKAGNRTVLRMTLVRDLNMCDLNGYAKLIKKASPNFVEIKAFMSVGFSRQRLGYGRMPSHDEIKKFSEKISKLADLKILDEKKESRVVLLGKKKENMKITGV